MNFDDKLVTHTITVVVARRERGISIQNWLKAAGYKVVLAFNQYDAVKSISQDMPHLIFSEALLPDGNAGLIYDRLQKSKILAKTPVVLYMIKKSKEEAAVAAGRQFAGLVSGKLDPKKVERVIKAGLNKASNASPYMITANNLDFDPKLILSLESQIFVKADDKIIASSGSSIDEKASMVCIPQDKKLAPALFKSASNIPLGENFYNIFPMGKIKGKGLKWIVKLPVIDIQEEQGVKQVLYFDPDSERSRQFHKILSGYKIELIHADTLSKATSILNQRSDSLGCVYLHEWVSDTAGIEWKKTYEGIAEEKRPPLIIATTSRQIKPKDHTIYLQRPFGIGVFVDTLKAMFNKSREIQDAIQSVGAPGVDSIYQAPAALLGLDESGGILQTRFPIAKGTKLEVVHEVLNEIWEEDKILWISESAPSTDNSNYYHVRFEAVPVGMSKTKYWEKMATALHPHRVDLKTEQDEKSA